MSPEGSENSRRVREESGPGGLQTRGTDERDRGLGAPLRRRPRVHLRRRGENFNRETTPGGFTNIPTLLHYMFRDRVVLVSPVSMHTHFGMRHLDYEQRKERVE